MEIELEDTDFYPPPPEHNPILAQSDADADGDAEMGEVQEAPTSTEIRREAVYLHGVDDLSTKDIKSYLLVHLPSSRPILEWVDDHSVVVVFDSYDEADVALKELSSQGAFYDGALETTVIRQAKNDPEHPQVLLSVRIAFQGDRKTTGARTRSRYYLLHGEPKSAYRDSKTYRPDPSRPKRVFGDTTSDELFPTIAPTDTSSINTNNDDQDDQDDLFPQKLAETKNQITRGEYKASEKRKALVINQKWKNDRFKDDDLFPNLQDRFKPGPLSERTRSPPRNRSRNRYNNSKENNSERQKGNNRNRSRSPNSLSSRLGSGDKIRYVNPDAERLANLIGRHNDISDKKTRKKRAHDLFG